MDCNGQGSDIEYCEQMYDWLANALLDSPRIILHDRFILAVTIVHEVAHAMFMLVADGRDCFFEDSVLAEGGFQWKAFLFGGIIREASRHKGSESSIDWREWDPSHDISSVLKSSPGKTNPETPSRVDIEDLPDEKVRWLMSIGFIQRLFQKRFWDVEVARDGPAALQCPRKFGYGWSYKSG